MPLVPQTQNDDQAFERLYRRYVANVYRYALAVLGERADAEDVTQTTFLNAYRAFQRGERPEKPENWLIVIAHNVCRQRFRAQRARPTEVEFADDLLGVRGRDDDAPTVDEMRQAFRALDPTYRAALVMRELGGYSYREIAEALGVTLPALETLIFRARRALREHLEEQLSCEEIAIAVSKQMDGELVPAEQRALRAHLRECPDCARLARSQRAQRKTLQTILAVPLPQSLKTFLPHATKTAAAATATGGAAAAGTSAFAVKAAAVVVAGTLVGGGGYVAVKHTIPLLAHVSPTPAHHQPAVRRPLAPAGPTHTRAQLPATTYAKEALSGHRKGPSAPPGRVRRDHASFGVGIASGRAKTSTVRTPTPAGRERARPAAALQQHVRPQHTLSARPARASRFGDPSRPRPATKRRARPAAPYERA